MRVGDILYGFCGGAFGRDSYCNKIVQAVGPDWVVVRSLDDPPGYRPDFYEGDPENLCRYRTLDPED